MSLEPELKKQLEGIQNSPASSALRALVYSHRKEWSAQLLGHPDSVTDRSREYAAGAAAALEQLYDELAKLMAWRKSPPTSPPERGSFAQEAQHAQPPPQRS